MTIHNESAVMAYIISFKRAHDGMPPSLSEISEACDIKSRSHVRQILRELQKQGKIEVLPRLARGIKVVGGEWIYAPRDKALWDQIAALNSIAYQALYDE